MSKDKEQIVEQLDLNINPQIQPLYSDQIVHIGVEHGIAKLMFATRFENAMFHNNTIAIPLPALLTFNELLNSEDFKKNIIERHLPKSK